MELTNDQLIAEAVKNQSRRVDDLTRTRYEDHLVHFAQYLARGGGGVSRGLVIPNIRLHIYTRFHMLGAMSSNVWKPSRANSATHPRRCPRRRAVGRPISRDRGHAPARCFAPNLKVLRDVGLV